MKISYLMVGLLGVLLLFPISYAADVVVSGTVTNSPPTFTNLYVTKVAGSSCTPAAFLTTNTTAVAVTPGVDSICVVLDGVNDPNGEADIILANSSILAWSAPGTEADAIAGDGWDHHNNFSFVDCTDGTTPVASLGVGVTKLCAHLPPNTDLTSSNGIGVKDISGNGWTIKATIEDSTAQTATASLASILNLSTVTGISVAPTACTFSGSPGTNLALTCGGTPTENVVMTHEGNISEETTIQMTADLTSGPDSIDGTSLFWNATQIVDPSTQLPGAFENLFSLRIPAASWLRGTPDTPTTQSTHLYITLPLSLNSGSYTSGVITYTATAT